MLIKPCPTCIRSFPTTSPNHPSPLKIFPNRSPVSEHVSLCVTGLNGNDNDPGGYGDSYFAVHGGGAETASSPADIWNASFSVPLREEPGSSADKLAQIPRGADVEQLDENGSWIQVRYTDEASISQGKRSRDAAADASCFGYAPGRDE